MQYINNFFYAQDIKKYIYLNLYIYYIKRE